MPHAPASLLLFVALFSARPGTTTTQIVELSYPGDFSEAISSENFDSGNYVITSLPLTTPEPEPWTSIPTSSSTQSTGSSLKPAQPTLALFFSSSPSTTLGQETTNPPSYRVTSFQVPSQPSQSTTAASTSTATPTRPPFVFCSQGLTSTTQQTPTSTQQFFAPAGSTQATPPRRPLVQVHVYAGSARLNGQANAQSAVTSNWRGGRPRKVNKAPTYVDCVDACGEERKPLCAMPAGDGEVDPDTLKGFPTLCHMSCWNASRKIQYEKLTDGRCGRLRTKIRPLNSNNKLNREEMTKTQYSVVDSPYTIIEFSPEDRSSGKKKN